MTVDSEHKPLIAVLAEMQSRLAYYVSAFSAGDSSQLGASFRSAVDDIKRLIEQVESQKDSAPTASDSSKNSLRAKA